MSVGVGRTFEAVCLFVCLSVCLSVYPQVFDFMYVCSISFLVFMLFL